MSLAGHSSGVRDIIQSWVELDASGFNAPWVQSANPVRYRVFWMAGERILHAYGILEAGGADQTGVLILNPGSPVPWANINGAVMQIVGARTAANLRTAVTADLNGLGNFRFSLDSFFGTGVEQIELDTYFVVRPL